MGARACVTQTARGGDAQHVGGLLLPGLVDSALRDGHQQVPFSLQTAIAVAAQLATVHECAHCERTYMPNLVDAVLGSCAASGVQSGLKFARVEAGIPLRCLCTRAGAADSCRRHMLSRRPRKPAVDHVGG